MNKNVKRLLALTMAFIMIFAAGIPVLADNTSTDHDKEPVLQVVSDDNGTKLVIKFHVNYEKSRVALTKEFKTVQEFDTAGKVDVPVDDNGNVFYTYTPWAADDDDAKIYLTVYDLNNEEPRYFEIFNDANGVNSVELQFDGKRVSPEAQLGTDANLTPIIKGQEVFVPGPVGFCLRWSYNDPNVGQDKYVLDIGLQGRIFYVDRGADPSVNPQYVDLETGEIDASADFVDVDTAGRLCFKGDLVKGKDYFVEWRLNGNNKDAFTEGSETSLITGIFYVSEKGNSYLLKGLQSGEDNKTFLLDDSRTWKVDRTSTEINNFDLGLDIPLTPAKLGDYLIKAVGSENQPVRNVKFNVYRIKQVDAYHYAKDQDGNYIVEGDPIFTTAPTNWNGYTGFGEIKIDPATGFAYLEKDNGEKVVIRAGEMLGIRAVKDGFPVNADAKVCPDGSCDTLDKGYKYNGNVYPLNIWKVKNVDRYNKALKTPSIDPKTVFELRDDKIVATVPFMDLFVTFRVKIFNAGATPQVREPITGAKVALYESGNTMVGEELKAGKLLLEKKTDQYGIAEFKNVPISQLKQFFNIGAPYCSNSTSDNYAPETRAMGEEGEGNGNDIVAPPAPHTPGSQYVCNKNYIYDEGMYRRVYMPYLIKQLDTGNHEGVAPYPYFISTAGYFEYENGSTRTFKNLVVTRADYGNVFDIEIENHVDFFGMAGRIAGENRYETSVEIAKKQFPNGLPEWSYEDENGRVYKNVVVAEVNTFADALTAGVVAYEYRAPLLMVKGDTLPESVADYIVESGATRAIIVGGNGTVSDKVANEIKDLGNPQPIAIQRLSGDNRFGTAVQVGDNLRKLIEANRANDSFTLGYDTKRTVFLANAYTFADALTASAPAAYYGIPILLTHQNKLAPETIEALKKWDIENVIIVGGEASVGKAVETELENLQIGGLTIERFSGANRQLTSMVLANKFFSDVTRVFFANKTSFADALAAAPYAAKVKAPIILVDKDAISNDVRDFLTRNHIAEGTIFGGYNQVSTQVRDELAKILNLRSEYPGIE